MLTLILMSTALAGYGDPVDGRPTWADRDLHHWTNAARVDPEAFEAHYATGGCGLDDFSAGERIASPALALHAALAEAAHVHADDLVDNNLFQHASSDGTDPFTRIESFYGTPGVGENISQGYDDEEATVLEGWMCSPDGHRANIMDPDFVELGNASVGDLRVQNFGARNDFVQPAIAMGVHEPAQPTLSVEFFADWTGPAAPASFDVWVNGEAVAMSLEYGSEGQGMYRAVLDPVPAETCVLYHFQADTAVWPETGSYGWGDCDWDDADAMWVDEQLSAGGTPAEVEGCGCSAARGPALWLWLPLVSVVLLGRRDGDAVGG